MRKSEDARSGTVPAEGIEAPWFVERVELKLARAKYAYSWSTGEKESWPCPECEASCQWYDHPGERQWRHLDSREYQTIQHARPPRTECSEHRVRVVKLRWAEPASRFTALMERQVIEWRRAASPEGHFHVRTRRSSLTYSRFLVDDLAGADGVGDFGEVVNVGGGVGI